MSNRSFNEVRRRGVPLVDLRDFQRGIQPPGGAPPPAPFAPSAPLQPTRPLGGTPAMPFGRRMASSSAPGLSPKGSASLLRYLRAVGRGSPWVAAAMLGWDVYEQLRGHPADIGPLPNVGANWALQFTCVQPLYNLNPYLVQRHLPGGCLAGFPPVPLSPIRIGVHEEIPAGWTGLGYDKMRPAGGGFGVRAAVLADWVRVAPGVSRAVIVTPAYWYSPFDYNSPFATPRPSPYPALDPFALPVGAPAPSAKPIPFKAVPHRLQNAYAPDQSEWGYGFPDDVVKPLPAIEVMPGSKTEIPPEHKLSRPPEHLKERKAKISTLAHVALKIVNTVTEAVDFIDSFYDALPDKYKKLAKHRGLRIMRPQHKLEVLYANWEHVDLEDAVKNLIENEVEDRVIGAISKKIGKLSKESGRPVGYEAGPGGPGKVPKGTKTGPSPWKNWTDRIWK